jgi:Ca2+-binding RTX toxin-like protein
MKERRLPLACALAASALLVAAAPASAVRYAAPSASGSGDCSSVANACTVSAAVEGDGSVPPPPSGEEIVVLAGDHVLPDTLSVGGTLNVHGQDSGPPPTLRRTGGSGHVVFSSLTSPGTLRRLRIHGDDITGSVAGVNASGVAVYSNLEVIATGATSIGFTARNGVVLRDSTVRVDNQFGVAVSAQEGVANKIVNVTAVATGTNSNGVSVFDFGSGGTEVWKLTMVNSIADGGLRDVRAQGSNAGDNVDIDVRNSNYAVAAGIGSGSQVNDLGGNQATAPLFANFAAGDFRQLLGSPTIDAGSVDPQLGSTDFDGQARTIGAAPDIGADEFQPASTGGSGTPGTTTPPPQGPAPATACANVQRGTPRADRLFGTGAGDLLIGGRGNDLLRGRGGEDCLRGELGRDRLEGGAGADRLLGGVAADTLVGGTGNDRLNAGAGSDQLAGSRGTDVLAGGSGADRLAGDGGVDVHRGGSGNDFLSAADGNREIVNCGSGRDRARVDRNDRVSGCERVVRVG